jgi:hypothetical protein
LNLSPECQRLLESLERSTARLAGLHPRDVEEVERALAERSCAIEALAGWVAAERRASRPVIPELASHLTRDLETGAEILLQLALDREATRTDLLGLSRELQTLRGLSSPTPAKPNAVDYQG